MAMDDSLPGLRPRLGEAGAANDIIQPPLTDGENLLARIPLLRGNLVVVAPELLLQQAVVMLDFLLFLRSQPPVGELSALNVHAGRIIAALQRPGRAGGFINQRAQAAIDPRLGTVVTGHAKSNSRTESSFRGS